MRLSGFTTVELQRVARVLLRRYLEVQTGAAPAADLGRLLAPVAAAGLHGLLTSQRGRPLRHADLGPITVLRLGPDRAYAMAAMAARGQGRPAVLSVELEVQVQRLVAVRVGETESRAAAQQRHELSRIGPGQPLPDPPAHMAGLLGDVPSDPRPLDRWVTAAAVIDTYRERYRVDDVTSAFGPVPDDAEQRQERERALAFVRELANEIEAVRPEHERTMGRDRPAGPELGP